MAYEKCPLTLHLGSRKKIPPSCRSDVPIQSDGAGHQTGGKKVREGKAEKKERQEEEEEGERK